MNLFKNIKSPTVLQEIDVYDFLDRIKKPDNKIKKMITKARNFYSTDKDKYDLIKASLPCFTLNFDFSNYKNDKNIKQPTGFIYIDVDGKTEIDLSNPIIFASWLSLSGRGRGVLVKVDGLTKNNIKDISNAISKNLRVTFDKYASKVTQYTVHSFDEDIYINDNSLAWIHEEEDINNNSSPITCLINKKKKGTIEMGEMQSLRFDNINEYDFGEEDYIYFKEEKEMIAKVNIPYKIYDGSRNSIVSAIAYQIRALNQRINERHLKSILDSINQKFCFPMIESEEMFRIVKNIMRLEELEPLLNTPRKYIFNPKSNLKFKEKMQIVNTFNGKEKSEKTVNELQRIIENWDIYTDGELKQRSLTEKSGKNKKTIEKYYPLFKNEIREINNLKLAG